MPHTHAGYGPLQWLEWRRVAPIGFGGLQMADWMVWLVLAGILVILELFSGTFYLLMLAIGLVAGALAAMAGAGAEVQIILAAIVGVVATAILHRSRFGWQGRGDS